MHPPTHTYTPFLQDQVVSPGSVVPRQVGKRSLGELCNLASVYVLHMKTAQPTAVDVAAEEVHHVCNLLCGVLLNAPCAIIQPEDVQHHLLVTFT